jgi:alpha-mannosidase
MNGRKYVGILFGVMFGSALCLAATAKEPSGKGTFWVIPHTHWEGAVFKTREEYLAMGLPNILKAMKLLREQPDYHFVLDQVAYVRPFLERFPDQEPNFRKFLAEGRLQLVGALDVMPDVNMPGGETFVRQMQYGKGYYRRKLGVDVTSAWLVDTFGHHAQMPQLLALGGYKSFWFSRGVPRPEHPSEFLWEGIDGTRIPAFFLPHSYGLLYGSPHDLPGFQAFALQRFGMLNANAFGMDRVGLSGVDVSEPEEHLVPLIQSFNKQNDAPFVMRMAVPSEFEAVVAKRPDRPVFKGELNPIFQGTYSSRIELKSWMRTLERKLVTAEKLAALAAWLGSRPDHAALWRAWEPVLFNETHDLSSGVMTDHVYEDTVRSYEFSNRLADELIEKNFQVLAPQVDTQGTGTAILVFNPLGWLRDDIAEVELGFAASDVKSLDLVDDAGAHVSVQVEQPTTYSDGSLKTAHIAFVAKQLPALGYRVFHVIGKSDGGSPKPAPATPTDTIETDLYVLKVDAATGAITRLHAKELDRDVFSGPANIIARQEDRGDLWELYRGLNGGSKIAMTNRQEVPRSGQAKFSHEYKRDPGKWRIGPVYSEFEVSHPFDTGSFASIVRVYQHLRRIECRTQLVNNEKYVRYQALFPTTLKNSKIVHEIPFGAIERPAGIEFPAQNWVDYSNEKGGMALLNIGLPGNITRDGTLMLSLLRAHTLGAYGFGGGYEPGMSSDSGFQLGQVRTMHYALLPHYGDWKAAGVARSGLEFNHPLLARVVANHPGPLPRRWGFLDVSAPNVVVSDLKPARDGGIVLRLYEAMGVNVEEATVKLNVKLALARVTNLLEDPGPDLTIEKQSMRLPFHPYEIKTVVFHTEPVPR